MSIVARFPLSGEGISGSGTPLFCSKGNSFFPRRVETLTPGISKVATLRIYSTTTNPFPDKCTFNDAINTINYIP
jgi:hypothetical protein